MKKIAAAAISTLALMTCISNAFATMIVYSKSDNVVSDPSYPFEGKINFVSYYFQTTGQTTQPVIAVDVIDENNRLVQVTFKDTDLTAGTALLNAIGKPLVVEFSDSNFTVSGVFTYDSSAHTNDNGGKVNGNRIKPTLASLHQKFQAIKK